MTTQHAVAEAALEIGFGDRLRRLRLSLGLNQEEFGESIDVSGATVGKYEIQGRTPRMGRVIASLVQLRYGRRYPDVDLRHWLLTGDIQTPQPTGYRVRLGVAA